MINASVHRILDAAGKCLRYTLPILISAVLVIWLLHRVNIHDVMRVISGGCDFFYIAIMMILTMMSFIIRGIRWGIQLRDVGIPPISPVAESVSIFGAYAMNLFFPFIGEAWRCVYMSRHTRTPLTTIVGTDLGDRISDAVVILMLVVLTLLVAHPAMMRFLDKYSMGRNITDVLSSAGFWIAVVIIPIIAIVVMYHFRRVKAIAKLEGGMEKMWHGFAILFHLKGIGMYIILTFGIWACYFLETYSCFMAFPFTRELMQQPGMAAGFLPALVVFVFGSCSVAVPSNGGLGPWNIAVMFALSLYGISEAEGAAYGLVVWSCQTLMIILLGFFAMGYISVSKHSLHKIVATAGGKEACEQ
ncbi:MAG: flippase-like domain-containing protein [Muribaculaceae bacterium]|nr:flippase-like domain-containing protein [Muribaculaceae bacterium]